MGGDKAVDIDILKKSKNSGLEQDGQNNMLLWVVTNLIEEGSAMLSFASERLAFDEIFPIDVRFEETYSLIDLNVEGVTNQSTGDALSLKTLHSLNTENYRISE